MSFRLIGAGYAHANGLVALRSISIEATQGERIAVIGPSGAGKTTLLRVLGASLRPTSGNIEALGVAPWALSASALRSLRARIGLVHQAPPLPPRQRVITAVLAGRLGQWPLWKSIASLIYPLDVDGAQAALLRLDLADRLFDRCDRLSGGQLQRVGIARVLYQMPDLVLADEPVSSLDPALALQTVKLLCADAQARNATLVASLHAVDLALSCFPRIVGLREGNVAFDLPTHKVTDALMHELYAIEGETLPTQGNDPRVLGAMTPPGDNTAAKVRLAG